MTCRWKRLTLAVMVLAATGVATAASAQTSAAVPSFNGTVHTVAYVGDIAYLGGDFTAAIVRGKPVTRGHLAAIDARTGELLSWAPAADGRVKALAVANGSVYLAGDFRTVGGQKRDSLARVDAATGALSSTFKHSINGKPYALTISGRRLYLGGAITPDGVYSAHGGHGGTVSSYTLAGTPRWSATFDGDAQAVTVLNGTVYAGGHFDRACTTTRTGPQGACLDGSVDRVKVAAFAGADGHLLDWTANANGILGVFALASSPTLGRLAMGGAFTVVDGQSQKRFAQFEVS
jgi:hypothetical protein